MNFHSTCLVSSSLGSILLGVVPCAAKEASIELPAVCGVTLKAPRLSWETFEDVEGALRQENYSVIQQASDIFSWQDFIALNWPASAERGVPAKDKPLQASGPRVWENWPAPSEVFSKSGEKPEWTSQPAADEKSAIKVLLDSNEPTVSNGVLPKSLKDQHGEQVYFEIRLNRVFFDYLVENKLYDAAIQEKLTSLQAPAGSIIVKAAWRVLGPDENDFYSTDAMVPDRRASGASSLRRVKVGLVGFHLMHKTPSAPQWIWSTFEHVRNVQGTNASFHSDRCTDCAVNIQTPDGVPNQVTRVVPIPGADPDCESTKEAQDNLVAMNKIVRAGLEPSAFQHYEQIGTQWPVLSPDRQGATPTDFEVRPALLGNTTLETFIQDSSSCMGCHAMARTVRLDQFVSSDFSFTLAQARPDQKAPGVIDPPKSPIKDHDVADWASILRGYQIATNTYETLPDTLNSSKLHCQSCHIDAGGNPKASWWVGMRENNKYPVKSQLMDRINQCFTKSMNGSPLDKLNPDMNALISYMSWLDGQAKDRKLAMPNSAFPECPEPQPTKTSPSRGGEIYLQKCAFCHGADGQGRYESGTYYRPALWGDHSFNQQAGMYSKPDYLPAFLKANMPFGSGGELTDQEAWDLAAYIKEQKRPSKPSN